ncbi:hypothetical protein ACUTFT_22435 [Citrobacter freundii]|jgi:hypothetical protein|uniref:PilX7 n=1 Tax=Enterobacter cloacae TaxID=550 RepID=A0A142BQ41_ENTCL|nr:MULTISPECIES: hypothetical protein [Enterobacteriaceae]AMP35199.1 PilX7 [Enterobacter cloacae]MCR2799253.1 hypothetical protein [Enterobacter kobei]MDT7062864.1 hypothetical protein [Citrobacter braakii]MDT7483295.1 hypothetical protein [Citrobacter portucalensis]WBU75748.1 hypothetical protein PGH06_25555 [Citrobacter braakii]
MKIIIALALACALTSCASHSPLPPDVSGELIPINSPEMMKNV